MSDSQRPFKKSPDSVTIQLLTAQAAMSERIRELEAENQSLRSEFETLQGADAFVTLEEHSDTNVLHSSLFIKRKGRFQFVWGAKDVMPDPAWPGSGPTEEEIPERNIRLWRNRAEWALSKCAQDTIPVPSAGAEKKTILKTDDSRQLRLEWNDSMAESSARQFLETRVFPAVDDLCARIDCLNAVMRKKDSVTERLVEELVDALAKIESQSEMILCAQRKASITSKLIHGRQRKVCTACKSVTYV